MHPVASFRWFPFEFLFPPIFPTSPAEFSGGSPWSYHHTGPRSLEVAINQAVEDSVNGKTPPIIFGFGFIPSPTSEDSGLTNMIWIHLWISVFLTRKKGSNHRILEGFQKKTQGEKKKLTLKKQKKRIVYHFKIAISSIFLGDTPFFCWNHAEFSYHPPLHHSGKIQLNSGSTAKLAKPKPSTPSNSKVINGSWLLASSSGVSQKWWYLRSTPRAPGCQICRSQMTV